MNRSDTPLTLEAKLCEFANRINTTIGKENNCESECSIYLYDYRRDMHVLRASTKITYYIGKEAIKLKDDIEVQDEVDNNAENVGLTVLALQNRKTIVSKPNILEDSRFRRYKKTDDADDWEDDNYCEYSLNDIGSIICSPIDFSHHIKNSGYPSKQEKIAGVVRIVRKKTPDFRPFNEEADVETIEKLIGEETSWIKSGVFISQLIELGTYMNVDNLCTKAAEIFKNMLYCKGCSIFLLDDNDKNCTDDNKIYKPYGTTGLVKRSEDRDETEVIEHPISDSSSWYFYNPKKYEGKIKPFMSLTEGVIRARACAFVNDIYDENEIEAQFPKNLKIKRERKVSHVCETGTTVDNKHIKSEGILYAPIYYCDPNDKFVDVLGIARLVRPKEPTAKPHKFSQEEIHLFVSLVERLSKAVLTAKFIEFLDDLGRKDNLENLLKHVVINMPKYIGANECAIFTVENDKLIKRASWYKGKVAYNDKNSKFDYDYDYKSPSETGYTCYVAQYKQTLIFNGLKDLIKQFPDQEKRPIHKSKGNGDVPYRYLGVPILDLNKNLISVIRLCKARESTRITKEDQQMMMRIASHLGPHIERFQHLNNQKLKLERKISQEMQEMIQKLENVECRNILKNNLLTIKHYVGTVEEELVKFIPKLWKYFLPSNGESGVKIIEKFEKFNTHILSEIPRYRDHYIHQLIVFLIGICIIDRLKKLENGHQTIEKLCQNAYHRKRFQAIDFKLKDIERIWFITALCHDLAYPLEKVNSWLSSILEIFIAESARVNNINISLSEILLNPIYIEKIEDLSKFHTVDLSRSEPNIRTAILEVLVKKDQNHSSLDHGIMGALILLSNETLTMTDILPSASAIALHNKLLERSEINAIYFEKHPFAFLLIYADLLHEWSRTVPISNNANSVPFPNFKRFIVKSDWKELLEQETEIKDYFQINARMANKPCIFSEIELQNYIGSKHSEARKKFEKLRSNEFNFIMKINQKYYYTKSDFTD